MQDQFRKDLSLHLCVGLSFLLCVFLHKAQRHTLAHMLACEYQYKHMDARTHTHTWTCVWIECATVVRTASP